MPRPTDAANAEERIARIERMVSELAAVEHKARGLAEDVRLKAQRLATARAQEIVAELESLEIKAKQIASEVAEKSAMIRAELAALKEAARSGLR